MVLLSLHGWAPASRAPPPWWPVWCPR